MYKPGDKVRVVDSLFQATMQSSVKGIWDCAEMRKFQGVETEIAGIDSEHTFGCVTYYIKADGREFVWNEFWLLPIEDEDEAENELMLTDLTLSEFMEVVGFGL